MTEHESSRTLVKSAPELWAECSDAAALARHLGSVGEIRITRLEPETTVAWEGAAARGTVQLESAGWGTRVTLTMTPTTELEALASGAAAQPPAHEPALEPMLEPEAAPDPAPPPEGGSWWARLRRRLTGSPATPRDATAQTPEPQPRSTPAEAPAEAASPPAPTDTPAPLQGESTLRAALDSLGRAHHRPYSRA